MNICEKCGATFYSETEFHEHVIAILADISNEFQIHSVLKICSEQHCSFAEASERYFDYWRTHHDVTQRKKKELQDKKQEENHEQR